MEGINVGPTGEASGMIEPLPDNVPVEDRALWDQDEEATSDYEPSLRGSILGSVTSSIHRHVWEHGRRYQVFRYGRYPLPNDEAEYQREYLRHVSLKELTSGKLYHAPLGKGAHKIVDLGTGFGDWAVEVGEACPGSQVLGVDLSPIQPVWLPNNVEFIVDDLEDNWVHGNDFDFMHLRMVCMTIGDVPALFHKIFQNLKPGGWVEAQELLPRPQSDDHTIPPDYPLCTFYDVLDRIMSAHYGYDLHAVERLLETLEGLGFVNIQRRIYHIPIGDWPRDTRLRMIGGIFREVVRDLVAPMVAKHFPEAGIDKSQLRDLTEGVKAALEDMRIHAYMPFHFIWAQKPVV